MQYKLLYLILIPVFCCSFSSRATGISNGRDSLNKEVEYRFALGIQVGTDIGGAIPFPMSYMPETFNPSPRLSPSLGAKLTFPIVSNWTLGAEFTYKKITMDADARVQDQRFKKQAENPGDMDIIASFTGTAEMNMDFSMMEVPVYVKYTFKSGKDRILFGPYVAWMVNSKFKILAQKGYMLDQFGNYDTALTGDPADDFPIEFSSSLDTWDMGIIAGYERLLFPRVELGLRVSSGFKDIFQKDEQYLDYKMKHLRGTVVISYNLFNIKPPKIRL